MFECPRGLAFAVEPAARDREDDALAAGKAFDATLAVAEGAPGDRNAIDPGLELTGDREVVERDADDDDIGGEELLEDGIAERQVGLQSRVLVGLRAAAGSQVGAGQMGDGRLSQVAIGDLQIRMDVPKGVRPRSPTADGSPNARLRCSSRDAAAGSTW